MKEQQELLKKLQKTTLIEKKEEFKSQILLLQDKMVNFDEN